MRDPSGKERDPCVLIRTLAAVDRQAAMLASCACVRSVLDSSDFPSDSPAWTAFDLACRRSSGEESVSSGELVEASIAASKAGIARSDLAGGSVAFASAALARAVAKHFERPEAPNYHFFSVVVYSVNAFMCASAHWMSSGGWTEESFLEANSKICSLIRASVDCSGADSWIESRGTAGQRSSGKVSTS